MKVSPALLCLLAPLGLGAQEVATWDHSLSMSTFGSEASLGALASRSSFTRADYRFDLGMPVFTYRLGALNLGGGLGYTRQAVDGEADSATGLNTLSLSGALFPYQRYHVTFDITRTTLPGLFGGGLNQSQTEGVDWIYRGRTLQDIRITYRHGALRGSGMNGDFTSWTVSEHQRSGRTDFRFYGDHQDAAYGVGAAFRSTTMQAATRTALDDAWTWTSSFTTFAQQTSRMTQAGTGLVGTFGPWTSTTFLDLAFQESPGTRGRSGGLSQSLARSWARLSAFGIAGLSGGTASGGGDSSAGNLILGASWRVTPAWAVSGDVSGAWHRTGPSPTGASGVGGASRSVHLATSWGGSVSDVVRRAFFYWSDLRFRQRLEDDYPPDYLPPEVVKAQLRRRMDQEGALQFSADIYRLTNQGPGKQTWFRMQGGLHFGNGLMLQTVGDLRVDDRMGDPGQRFRNEHLMIHGAYRLGRASLRFSGGLSRATSEAVDPTAGPGGYSAAVNGRAVTYFSGGLNGSAWGVPYGAMLLRNNDALGTRTTTLLTYTSIGFRKLSVTFNFQRGWRSDGLRTGQVSLQVGRAFDTIPLWGLGD